MKKLFVGILMVMVMVIGLMSCGWIERSYDSSNYESITNERGDIELYSGGKLVESYKNIKVIYSSSDSFALWFKTDDGEKIYWQGEARIKLKD